MRCGFGAYECSRIYSEKHEGEKQIDYVKYSFYHSFVVELSVAGAGWAFVGAGSALVSLFGLSFTGSKFSAEEKLKTSKSHLSFTLLNFHIHSVLLSN